MYLVYLVNFTQQLLTGINVHNFWTNLLSNHRLCYDLLSAIFLLKFGRVNVFYYRFVYGMMRCPCVTLLLLWRAPAGQAVTTFHWWWQAPFWVLGTDPMVLERMRQVNWLQIVPHGTYVTVIRYISFISWEVSTNIGRRIGDIQTSSSRHNCGPFGYFRQRNNF